MGLSGGGRQRRTRGSRQTVTNSGTITKRIKRMIRRGQVSEDNESKVDSLVLVVILIVVHLGTLYVVKPILNGDSVVETIQTVSLTGELKETTKTREPFQYHYEDIIPLVLNYESRYTTDQELRNLDKSLDYFYQKTGVRTHLILLDETSDFNIKTLDDLEAVAHYIYDGTFNDEGRLLIVYYNEPMDGKVYYVVGKDAEEFMDPVAGDILLDEWDEAIYTNNTHAIEQIIGNALERAAHRLME